MQSEVNVPGDAAGVIHVTNQQELNEALAAARGGETISLSAGEYETITLFRRDFSEAVRITSTDPDNPATITGTVTIKSVSNLAIDTINVIGEEPLTFTSPRVYVQNSADIAITGVTIVGVTSPTGMDPDDPAATAQNLLRGIQHENGVRIVGSTGVTLENMDISNVMNGVSFSKSAGITVRASEFHDIRTDGVNFVNSSDIVIEDSYFHDFHPWYGSSIGVGDHPDFIQYFGGGDGIDNVAIRNNIFLQGDGGWTQTIHGHAGAARDTESPFTNFEVSGNFIQNGHLAGIQLIDVIGGSIHHNVLIPTGYEFENGLSPMRPAIQISAGYRADSPRDIEIHDNILTLSWRPVFDPSGLSEEELLERNISIGENSFIDQGAAIPLAWAELELPDPNAFASQAAWLEEAMEMISNTVNQINGGGAEPSDDTEPEIVPPVEAAELPDVPPAPEPPVDHAPESDANQAQSLFTGHGDDVVMGGAGNDTLYTRGGDDMLYGEDGNDRLTGGAGSDTMTGGAGADQFVFEGFAFKDGDRDVITDLNFSEGDTLSFSHFSEGTFGAAAGGFSFGAIVRNVAQLSALDEIEGFDFAWGADGELTLAIRNEEGGLSTLKMTLDNDSAEAMAKLFVRVTDQGTAGADSLFTGHNEDVVMGGAGNDTLYTRGGDDMLYGEDGNDRLTGGAGSDTMTGGAGADMFVFESFAFKEGDRDVITDLNFGEGDTLSFSHFSGGTFGAAAGGFSVGAVIRNVAQLSALDDIEGFDLQWSGDRSVTLSVDHPSTEAATIEIGLDLFTATELSAVWQYA